MNETLQVHIKRRANGFEILFDGKPTTGNMYDERLGALEHLTMFLDDDEGNGGDLSEGPIVIKVD